MSVTITCPTSELQLGRIRTLTDNPTTDHRRGGPSVPPLGPPPRADRGGGRGDDERPSRLAIIAQGLAAIADLFLLAAIILLLHARMR